ncbi:MAG TPA: alpha/beta fold hydrolase [Caulobacteraceae bacterium]|nr:alpha/beta fold hydrolase [Caulobacteraceae bacterium]
MRRAAWFVLWLGLLSAGTPVTARAATAPPLAGLDGDWDGALHVGAVTLRLALHVTSGSDGTHASLDSIDQGVNGLPVAALTRDGAAVRFAVASVGGVFEGELAADEATITGTWTQAASPLPLAFHKRAAGAPQAALDRPQTPRAPWPYRVDTVAFDGGATGVRLAGTLTLPAGAGPFPAVVLIAGSGPNDRDETILGHKPFWVLADYLSRRGIAVLRYDKRGVKASTGDYARATTLDFAADAGAAAAWLRARPRIDPNKVGLIGHSEGGIIAPAVAAKDPAVAFVVLLAGPGVNGGKILELQGPLMLRAAGTPEARVAAVAALNARVYAAVESAGDEASASARAKAVLTEGGPAVGLAPAAIDAQAKAAASDWFRFFLTYDPVPALKRLRCPVLALSGSLDLQVPPAQNVPVLKAALAANSDATVEVIGGLNHLFQPARTGGVGEYAAIPTTISPDVLATIGDWIARRVR